MKKLLIALMLLAALPAGAATLASGESYALPSGERVSDNLYVAGGTLIVAGDVVGDVTAAGGKVTITGTTTGDANIGAGNVDILGKVGGDVRVGSGDVIIAGSVGGDLVVFGGTLHLLPGSSVNGDLLMLGGTLTIEGTVRGSVKMKGGSFVLKGETGALSVDAGTVSLVGAHVHGNFEYRSSSKATIDDTTVISGKTTFTQTTPQGSGMAALAVLGGLFFLGKFLALLVASLVVFFLMRGFAHRVGTRAVSSWGHNSLWGLVALVVPPVLALILLVTVVGSILGILGFVGYALLLVAAKILSAIVAGAVLSRVLVKEVRVSVAWIILGSLFIGLLAFIPFIGWIVSFVMYLMTLGVLAHMVGGLFFRLRHDEGGEDSLR